MLVFDHALRKPLRAISPFRHQDAQTPPSPRVGEGGWEDEGQKPSSLHIIPPDSTPRRCPDFTGVDF